MFRLNIDVPVEAPPRDRLVIRPATSDDEGALWRLAHRDSRPVPRGPLVVAEVDGVLVAALDTESGESIAEPFRRTAHILRMLEAYAGRLPERAA